MKKKSPKVDGRSKTPFVMTEARKAVFENNFNEILKHNSGGASWKKGVNKFTDFTADELSKHFIENIVVVD